MWLSAAKNWKQSARREKTARLLHAALGLETACCFTRSRRGIKKQGRTVYAVFYKHKCYAHGREDTSEGWLVLQDAWGQRDRWFGTAGAVGTAGGRQVGEAPG